MEVVLQHVPLVCKLVVVDTVAVVVVVRNLVLVGVVVLRNLVVVAASTERIFILQL